MEAGFTYFEEDLVEWLWNNRDRLYSHIGPSTSIVALGNFGRYSETLETLTVLENEVEKAVKKMRTDAQEADTLWRDSGMEPAVFPWIKKELEVLESQYDLIPIAISALQGRDLVDKKTDDIGKTVTFFEEQPPEITLHSRIERVENGISQLVEDTLTKKFEEEDWWVKGVPKAIRAQAAEHHENINQETSKQSCLTLIQYKSIIEKQWELFKTVVDPENMGKQHFASSFQKLSDLRNRCSHPRRIQEKPATESELEILKLYEDRLKN